MTAISLAVVVLLGSWTGPAIAESGGEARAFVWWLETHPGTRLDAYVVLCEGCAAMFTLAWADGIISGAHGARGRENVSFDLGVGEVHVGQPLPAPSALLGIPLLPRRVGAIDFEFSTHSQVLVVLLTVEPTVPVFSLAGGEVLGAATSQRVRWMKFDDIAGAYAKAGTSAVSLAASETWTVSAGSTGFLSPSVFSPTLLATAATPSGQSTCGPFCNIFFADGPGPYSMGYVAQSDALALANNHIGAWADIETFGWRRLT